MLVRHTGCSISEVELIRGEVVQKTVVDRVLEPVEFLRTCAVVEVWIRQEPKHNVLLEGNDYRADGDFQRITQGSGSVCGHEGFRVHSGC